MNYQARVFSTAKCFVFDDSGTTAIEYALIAVCISIAIVGSVSAVGDALVSNYYEKIVEGVQNAVASGAD